MLRQACLASVAPHQAVELDPGDRKQSPAAAVASVYCTMLYKPGLDRGALVQELVLFLDKRLDGAQRAFQPLDGQVTVDKVLGREADRFARTQAVPEAHQQKHPVTFACSLRLSQHRQELLAGKMFHVEVKLVLVDCRECGVEMRCVENSEMDRSRLCDSCYLQKLTRNEEQQARNRRPP